MHRGQPATTKHGETLKVSGVWLCPSGHQGTGEVVGRRGVWGEEVDHGKLWIVSPPAEGQLPWGGNGTRFLKGTR